MNKNKGIKKSIIGITLAAIMIASIFAAINPATVVAAPDEVTVDGDRSEWLPGWWLASDPDDLWDNGYDLLEVYNYYSAIDDKFYVMYVVDGIAGDSNGNGTPNLPDDGINDEHNVGPKETYAFAVNLDNDTTTGITVQGYDGYDLTVVYTNNDVDVDWYGLYSEPTGFVAEAAIDAIGTVPFTDFTDAVEFSISNASEYLNPSEYVFFGYVGSAMDGETIPEDVLEEPITPPPGNPPEFLIHCQCFMLL